jgi:hypothetical protein
VVRSPSADHFSITTLLLQLHVPFLFFEQTRVDPENR